MEIPGNREKTNEMGYPEIRILIWRRDNKVIMSVTSVSLFIVTNTLLQLVFKTFPLLSCMRYFQTKYYMWPVIALMFWQCGNRFKCTVFTINTDCILTIRHSNQSNTIISLTNYCCGAFMPKGKCTSIVTFTSWCWQWRSLHCRHLFDLKLKRTGFT